MLPRRRGALGFLAGLTGLAGATGVARADDCSPEADAATVRAPVVVAGGRGLVLASSFQYEGGEQISEGEARLFALPAVGAPSAVTVTARGAATLSPSLLTRPDGALEVVAWRQSADATDLVGTPVSGRRAGADRLVVGGLRFPGLGGVAAARSPDGTITVIYGVAPASPDAQRPVALRRIAPDGTLGAEVALPGVADAAAPRVAVDAQGTAYALVPGKRGGVAVRWPAQGDPQIFTSEQLAENPLQDAPFTDAADGIVPDGHGGAWARLPNAGVESLAHVTASAPTVTRIASAAQDSAGPAVSATGTAYVAWSPRSGGTVLQAVSLDGRLSDVRRLAGRVAAVAVDPNSDRPAALALVKRARRPQALVLERAGGHSLTLRARRGYQQDVASLAFGPQGRAWAVWEEYSLRTETTCNLFPLHEAVRWATIAPGARRARSRVLRGAPTVDYHVGL